MATSKRSKNKNSIWLLLLRNRMFLGGIGIVLFFSMIALLAPVIAPTPPEKFVGGANIAPSAEFWFGTTALGKDVFSQTVWGARNSLIIGFGTAVVATIAALLVGMTAGYFGGTVDDVLTLIMNVFFVIPGLPLLIVLSGYLNPGTTTVIFVLALTGWAFAARIVRSQMLSLRSKDFVAAAKVSGESNFRIIFVEIMPNMASIIVGLAVGAAGLLSATCLSARRQRTATGGLRRTRPATSGGERAGARTRLLVLLPGTRWLLPGGDAVSRRLGAGCAACRIAVARPAAWREACRSTGGRAASQRAGLLRRHRSGSEPLANPLPIAAEAIAQAIVQAALAPLPEFPAIRVQAVATPMRGARRVQQEPGAIASGIGDQYGAAGNDLALRAGPGANS